MLVVFILFLLLFPRFNNFEMLCHRSRVTGLSLFYSGKRLYSMAEAYGAEFGRQAFIDVRWTMDLAFPVVYTLFLVTSIVGFCAKSCHFFQVAVVESCSPGGICT